MNNRKIFAYGLILFVFLVPFRFALLTPTNNNVINLVSFLATILGFIIFMLMTITEGKEN